MKDHSTQINPALTVEDFGEEIIIVHLQTGAYFSLKGTAADVWRAVAQNPTAENPLTVLSRQFTLDENAANAVRQLLLQFQADELMDFPAITFTDIFSTALPAQAGKPAFSQPVYEKFDNMQDILLLDPIHDVSELGWPYRK